jgi:hypothetical protein
LERLEERVVLAATAAAQVLPLHPPSELPYGEGQPDLASAEVAGLYQLILGRSPDSAGQNFWTSEFQSGARPADVVRSLLKSPEFYGRLIDSYYQNFLGRAADSDGTRYWTSVLANGGDTTTLTVGITTGAEYGRNHPTDAAFVQSLYENVLGRQASAEEVSYWTGALAGGVSRASVAAAFPTSPESLKQSVEEFYQVFLQRPADAGGLAYWVGQAQKQGLAEALPRILSTSEFQFLAAEGTAAQPYNDFFGMNQQMLAADSVTDAAASGAGGQAASGLVPKGSPWGNALVFPKVSYDLTQSETGPQPTLQLPAGLVKEVNLNQGGTFEFWFQAKNPGALLSADLPMTGGDSAARSYPAPLIYINSSGNLVAGLFDETALSIIPNQSPLSWKDAAGETHIGAAHPLTSQLAVVDNTWHHAALVVSAQSESLYLDGMLQGTSEARYHQSSASLTSPSPTLTLALDKPPLANQLIQGTISQRNPASDTTYGPGGSTVIGTFKGWLQPSGETILDFTSSNNSTTVSQVVYQAAAGGSPASLVLSLSGALSSGNALTVDASYRTADSAYSFDPASSSTFASLTDPHGKASFGAPTNFTLGGTIIAEPTARLYPATNYPQGFVGGVDDLAVWNAALSQPQVQAAMSGPILPAGAGQSTGNLVGYFPFTQTVSGKSNEWPNEAPGNSSFATGPTIGTTLTPVSSTIPTDPFSSAQRLPGSRNWGLRLMTPLSSPSATLPSSQTVEYKTALAAGDQLAISLPQGQQGSLAMRIEDDLGSVSGDIQMSPGDVQYLPAPRSGTYELTLSWTASQNQSSGAINFGLIPGPLNSVMELFTGYVHGISQSQTDTLYAYSDPSLPGVNPTVGAVGGTGPANYWPYWTDASYFPASQAYTPADLNAAYLKLDAALSNLHKGLSDFGNLNGAAVANPADIQTYLEQSYQHAYQKAPPTPPGSGPFPVAATGTAEEAVYEFLYNANLLREAIYPVLTGKGSSATPNSLPVWVQGVIDAINASNAPAQVATTIASGQTEQVQDIVVNVPQASQKQSVGDILEGGAAWAAGSALSAVASLAAGPEAGAGVKALVVLGAGLFGGAASIGQSFINNSAASAAGAVPLAVPVTALTNSELNYQDLSYMAGSLHSAALTQWSNIYDALTSDALVQEVMSNFGLMNALQNISGAPLSDPAAAPANAVAASLSRASWQQMIPATFNWTALPPEAIPSGNGQTNAWTQSGPYSMGSGSFPYVLGVTTADFNKDGKPDLALAENDTDDVSVMLGAGGGAFQTGLKVSLDGPDGARGIVAGDLNNDGNPDLAVANYNSSDVSVLLGKGDGSFQNAITVSLHGGHGASGIVAGDFNHDGKLDLAVTNTRDSDISILLGQGTGYFDTAVAHSLNGPSGAYAIGTADFNHDGKLDLAVGNGDQSVVSVLLGNGDGTFQTAQSIDIHEQRGSMLGMAVGDLNGDGISDIATANSIDDTISVVLNNGDGTFQDAVSYHISAGGSYPAGIALLSHPSGPADLVVTNQLSKSLNIFVNRGNGTFYPPIDVPNAGADPGGLAVADFAGNGRNQVAIANDYTVTVSSPGGVGNTATFLPGTSSSNTPLSGPTDLSKAVEAVALDKLLTQMESLQGGNTVYFGPFDERNLISPGGPTPPNYLAYTSLTYPPDLTPLSAAAPGLFLSVTPATLHETGQHGETELNYTQNGAYLNGWQLQDANHNPIAQSTLQQLFGTPSVNSHGQLVGVNLTPINASQPFGAFNGGWYFAAQPVGGASAAWADAFFNWGQGTSGYSSRNLLPTQLNGQLPNTSTHDVSSKDILYQLTFQPASGSPPAVSFGFPVDLSNAFNQSGIVNDGTTFSSNGGVANSPFALSAMLLGAQAIADGVQFNLGTPGMKNVVAGAGQAVTLPAGSFSTLHLLAFGANGNQPNQTFKVTYSDGSTGTFTQSLSDWYTPQNYQGETDAATMAYRAVASGDTNPGPVHAYAYAFTLDNSKTVQSITLPNNGDVIIAALTLQ